MFWEKTLKITLLSNIAFRLNQVFRFESRAFKTTYKTSKKKIPSYARVTFYVGAWNAEQVKTSLSK